MRVEHVNSVFKSVDVDAVLSRLVWTFVAEYALATALSVEFNRQTHLESDGVGHDESFAEMHFAEKFVCLF